MATLAPNTFVTIVVSGAAGSWIPFTTPSPETLKARVTATLKSLRYGVNKFDISTSTPLDDILNLRGSYPYVGELVIQNAVYEDSALTLNTVAAAFATAAGEAPSASAITQIGTTATGAPAPKRTDIPPPAGAGLFDAIGKLFREASSVAKFIAIAIIAVVVGLLFFSRPILKAIA